MTKLIYVHVITVSPDSWCFGSGHSSINASCPPLPTVPTLQQPSMSTSSLALLPCSSLGMDGVCCSSLMTLGWRDSGSITCGCVSASAAGDAGVAAHE